MWDLKLIGFCVLLCATAIVAERTYTVTAPKNVRSNTPYQVVASVHNTPEPVTIVVNVTCSGEKSNDEQSIGEITVANGETKAANLTIGDWKNRNCELSVAGSEGIVFQRKASLGFNDKKFSIFLQTDKAIYQPGQLVQFRLIAVDENLKPHSSDELQVFIQDAERNTIKQWKNATIEKGLYNNSLQLSDQPVLGDWSIQAMLDGNTIRKSFTVAEYVLPKFEVSVRPPPFGIFNDTDIVVSIDAKYTFGKPVKGKVVVNATEGYCRTSYSSYCGSTPVVVESQIDGTAHVKIPIAQFNFPSYYLHGQTNLDFLATVTEELTGKQMNGTGLMTLYPRKEAIDISQSTPTFKPGLRHTLTIKVKYQDGTPVHDADEKLKVKYGFSYGKDEGDLLYDIPKNGTVVVDLYPSEDSELVRLTAEYKDASSSSTARKAQSISTKYLLLSLNADNPKVGDIVNVDLNATFYFSQIDYEVVARGKIVASGSLDFGNETKHQVLPVQLTQDMAPRARVVAYYVSLCGEVVVDGLDFLVDGVFQTPVDLSTSDNHTKPGAPLDVVVHTHPNALVGLLAVDQSVLLLKSGNDITNNEIVSDLDGYESGWRPSSYDRKKRSVMTYWRPPTETVDQLFNHAGLVFLSNGLFQKSGSGYGGYDVVDYIEEVAPLMAMADAPMFAPGMGSSLDMGVEIAIPEPKLRKHFPETWIWNGEVAGKDGKAVLNTVVPDTITSWVISAFALDEEHGLGLADGPAKVEVFRPFFVTLNLPYSVVRGEAVSIQAIVFNYLKEDVEAEVTLENPNDQFELLGHLNSVDNANASTSEKKTVKVKAGDGASVSFLIEPKVVGHIDLKVVATSPKAGDALIRKLLVKAEGIPQYFNKAVLVDLRNTSSFSSKVVVDVPEFAVNDSEHVEVSAIGDIMGPTINNIDHLLRMPSGCGEQNMVNFVPNIVVADYLNLSSRLTDELKNKAVKNMEAGYQRELTYKRNDGSFSAFGNSDKAGSTWLTAFVARSFNQAKQFISIDEAVIDSALRFLAAQHEDNGTFSEPGVVHHKGLQGHSGSGVGLTAYTLLTFLEMDPRPEYKNLTDVTVRFLEDELDSLDDTYELAIVTYVLNRAKSPASDKAFEKLLKRAERQGDRVHWSKQEEKPTNETERFWYRPPSSLTVEATSYALQTHVFRNQIADAIPIMRYLISQRNELGGYASTQDTVIAIQAMANIASEIASPPGSKVNVDLKYGDGRSKSLTMDSNNALVLQRIELPNDVKEVEIVGHGNGVGIVQVTWSYNLDNKTSAPSFEVTPKLKTLDKDSFELTVCTTYTGEDDSSNMAVIEVNLPSGYSVDPEVESANSNLHTLKRVDITEGATKVELYFDQLDSTPVCPHVTAYRAFNVANIKPAAVIVYDYYDNQKRAEAFYAPPATSLCDICTGSECSSDCKNN